MTFRAKLILLWVRRQSAAAPSLFLLERSDLREGNPDSGF